MMTRMRGRSGTSWWGVVLDAPDPEALAEFYSGLLGWQISSRESAWLAIQQPGTECYLGFHENPDYVSPTWPPAAGEQQMMMHLDFEVDDLAGAVEDAIAAGARIAEFQPQQDVRVMLDPVGHPFCLYSAD